MNIPLDQYCYIRVLKTYDGFHEFNPSLCVSEGKYYNDVCGSSIGTNQYSVRATLIDSGLTNGTTASLSDY